MLSAAVWPGLVVGATGAAAAFGVWAIARRRRDTGDRVFLEHLFNGSPEATALVDNEDRVLRINQAFTDLFGYDEREAVGRTVAELIVPEGEVEAARSLTRRITQRERLKIQSRRRKRNGDIIEVAIVGAPVIDESGQIAAYAMYRDITERHDAERRVRDSEERYALAARGANDVLWDWDLASDSLYVSPRWYEMLGYERAEGLGSSPSEWFDRVHDDDRERFHIDVQAHRNGESPHLENEHRLKARDGRYIWVLCRGAAISDDRGRAMRMAGSLTDITERKRVEERLYRGAFHDDLTGLPNRALFTNLLKQAMGRAQRAERKYAVLFVDLDRFKVINDSLGHAIGDQLLTALARRLESCIRPGDTVARLGGDEFTVLLDDIVDASDATRVADRITDELKASFELDGHEVFTSASIGIAFGSPHYTSPEDVVRDADLAMYRAKHPGWSGAYEVFDREMHDQAVAQLRLENDLRKAIERDEFELFYQPIIALSSNTITGFEALLRWHHPSRGLLRPDEFIGMAEETGLIVSIGEWALVRALEQLREWQTDRPVDPPISMSINISPRQMQQPDTVEKVITLVRGMGVDPATVKLEVTEGLLMDSAEENVTKIKRLADAGIQVLIDDFGTGYSSLSYLHQFDVGTLKIDRSFVARLSDADENLEIVRTIVTLSRALGMSVIAEGVETEAQQRFLETLECEEVQGYLFSRAVDRDSAARLLEAQR